MDLLIKIIFAVSLVMFAVPTMAADEDVETYVFADIEFDDNVFRVSGSEEAQEQLNESSQSDTIAIIGVGTKIRLPISRQQLNIDAEINRIQYDRFDDLNSTNGRFHSEWEWVYGRSISGDVGYRFDRRVSDFFEPAGVEGDTVETQTLFSSTTIPLHRRWDFVFGGNLVDQEFEERTQLDRETLQVYGEFLFRTRGKTFIGLGLVQTEGDFDTDQNSDFDQTDINLLVRRDISDKSRVSLSVGRSERDPDDPQSGEFSGTIWEADYRYGLSGKTFIDFRAFRETQLIVEVNNLVISQGIDIEPQWRISPRLTLSGLIGFQEREFEGGSNSSRDDDLTRLRTNVNYRLSRALTLNFSLNYSTRDSNDENAEFDRTAARLGLRFTI